MSQAATDAVREGLLATQRAQAMDAFRDIERRFQPEDMAKVSKDPGELLRIVEHVEKLAEAGRRHVARLERRSAVKADASGPADSDPMEEITRLLQEKVA